MENHRITTLNDNSLRTPLLIFGGAIILLLFVVRGLQPESGRPPTVLTAQPSYALSQAARDELPSLPATIAEDIQRHGYVSVTIHVGLFDRDASGATFANGDDPRTNLYWGALYGIDTHLPNAADWRRVHRDQGRDEHIIARSVFQKHVTPSEHWVAFGVTRPFDVYVLANAWRHDHLVEAMEQPIRDAICGAVTQIPIEGRLIEFAGASAVVGYVGQNHMLDEYWDPLARLDGCHLTRRIGIFYAAPFSAAALHRPLEETGLYSVLFTRNRITPEAYVVDGILDALIVGDLDDGFVDSAAAQYARYQKGVGIETARSFFIR
ncbi:MAG TPA: hypothetical protein P5081_01815 [Phycisphaerae bacterium]|nr:hypothetical protein [Phycisphaerae bacterium]HRW51591.1 hypothetical protein [Phycisphaerae bacterium]